MKKRIFTLFALATLSLSAFAQAPQKMSYQAVVRNASNNLVATQSVGMQISILQGSITGPPVYVETQSPTTNQNGLVSIEIGGGTVVAGSMGAINWSNGPYFIKTETDPTGGTNYTIVGTTQLMSVPYALHAATADSVKGGISFTETDPIFGASVASGITVVDTAKWNKPANTQLDSTGIANFGYVAGPHTVDTQIDSLGIANLGYVAGPKTVDTDTQLSEAQVDAFVANNGYLTTEIDSSITNEIQAISLSNDTLFLSDGGFVKLPAGFDGNYSSLSGAPTNVSAFTNDANYLTTEVDGSITNEIQVISLSNDTVFLSDGGFVKLPAGFDGNYSSLSGAPTNVSAFTNDANYLTTEVDGSITNEIQAISLSNDTVFLSDGGFVKLPAGFDGNYSSLSGAPTNVSAFTNDANYLTTEVDGSVTNEIELPTGGNNGQVLKTDGSGNYAWIDQTVDTDTDTQIDSAGIAALGFVAGNHSNALVFKGAAIAKNQSSSNPNVNNEIPNGASTPIRWLNTNNNYQNSIGGTNNTEITVPAGIRFIRINCVINFDKSYTSNQGEAQFIVYKNGNPFNGLTNSGYMTYQFFNYAYSHNYHSTLIPVVAGDKFTINLYQTSGSSLYLSWGSISTATSFEFYE